MAGYNADIEATDNNTATNVPTKDEEEYDLNSHVKAEDIAPIPNSFYAEEFETAHDMKLEEADENNSDGSLADEESDVNRLKQELKFEHKVQEDVRTKPNGSTELVNQTLQLEQKHERQGKQDCQEIETAVKSHSEIESESQSESDSELYASVPFFKTIEEEEPEVVLQQLRETERKFHITLNSVADLEEELGIRSSPFNSATPSRNISVEPVISERATNESKSRVDEVIVDGDGVIEEEGLCRLEIPNEKTEMEELEKIERPVLEELATEEEDYTESDSRFEFLGVEAVEDGNDEVVASHEIVSKEETSAGTTKVEEIEIALVNEEYMEEASKTTAELVQSGIDLTIELKTHSVEDIIEENEGSVIEDNSESHDQFQNIETGLPIDNQVNSAVYEGQGVDKTSEQQLSSIEGQDHMENEELPAERENIEVPHLDSLITDDQDQSAEVSNYTIITETQDQIPEVPNLDTIVSQTQDQSIEDDNAELNSTILPDVLPQISVEMADEVNSSVPEEVNSMKDLSETRLQSNEPIQTDVKENVINADSEGDAVPLSKSNADYSEIEIPILDAFVSETNDQTADEITIPDTSTIDHEPDERPIPPYLDSIDVSNNDILRDSISVVEDANDTVTIKMPSLEQIKEDSELVFEESGIESTELGNTYTTDILENPLQETSIMLNNDKNEDVESIPIQARSQDGDGNFAESVVVEEIEEQDENIITEINQNVSIELFEGESILRPTGVIEPKAESADVVDHIVNFDHVNHILVPEEPEEIVSPLLTPEEVEDVVPIIPNEIIEPESPEPSGLNIAEQEVDIEVGGEDIDFPTSIIIPSSRSASPAVSVQYPVDMKVEEIDPNQDTKVEDPKAINSDSPSSRKRKLEVDGGSFAKKLKSKTLIFSKWFKRTEVDLSLIHI